MPAAPSAGPPPSLASLRTNQPRAQGTDARDGLSRRFLGRPDGLVDDGHLAGFAESQTSRAGATAEGADAAHIPRLLIE